MGHHLLSPKAIVLFAISLLLLLFGTVWAYWPALSGPFLFDDFGNLNALASFNEGVSFAALRDYLLTGTAGPGGRPLSLLSFLIDDVAWPTQPLPFKYTNLLIHLLNGCLLLWLLVRLAGRMDGGFNPQRQFIVLLLLGFWLLSPYHVSAVMYVVQRMALLAATFVLAGLVLFVVGRERLERGQAWQGYLLIWLSYLVGAGLGIFSKENAALFVLMTPLLAWLCFNNKSVAAVQGPAKPVPVAWLLKLTLALPALLLIVAIASRWPSFAEQYQTFRDFTLSERLFSQFRALGYYLWRYLLPGVGYIGIYADGFEKSLSLLQPLSTLLWMLGHVGIITAAILLRQRWPMLTLGVLFYYVAHALESSVVPLELFFEHRNYLPSMLLLLGLLHLPKLAKKEAIIALMVLLASLGLLRLQAGYWGSEPLLKAVMMAENPKSERAVISYGQYLQSRGQNEEVLALFRDYASQHQAGVEVALNAAGVACSMGQDNEKDVANLRSSAEKYRGKADFVAGRMPVLARLVASGQCQSLTMADLEAFLERYVTAFPRDDMSMQGYHISHAYLQLYGGNYAGFSREAKAAMAFWPNRELVLGLCWQMHVIGRSDDACACFSSQADIFDTVSNTTNRSVLRSAAGYSQILKDEFMSKQTQVCALEQEAGDLPANEDNINAALDVRE